jgi:hypothetical protein
MVVWDTPHTTVAVEVRLGRCGLGRATRTPEVRRHCGLGRTDVQAGARLGSSAGRRLGGTGAAAPGIGGAAHGVPPEPAAGRTKRARTSGLATDPYRSAPPGLFPSRPAGRDMASDPWPGKAARPSARPAAFREAGRSSGPAAGWAGGPRAGSGRTPAGRAPLAGRRDVRPPCNGGVRT